MKILFILLLFSLSTPNLFAQSLDDLVFVTEEYPPFNFTTKGELRGIATDTLVAMLQRLQTRHTRADIGLLPWAQGYNLALHNQNTVLFSTTRTKAREQLFKWVGPIVHSEIVLFARKDQQLDLKKLTDINRLKLRVGAVLDDVGEQLLREQGVDRDRIYRYNKGIHLAQMLQRQRIDLLAYGKLVTHWNLQSLGLDINDFQIVYTLQQADYYYALNKKIDDQIVSQLQEALNQLKDSGELRKIISRYHK